MYTDETVLVLNNPTLLNQIFDRNHIPSCTSAGSVLQLCKVSFKSNEPFRRSCAYTSPTLHTERISEYKLNYLPFQILDSNQIPSCTSDGSYQKFGRKVM
jgi:hypothetical protein